MGWNSDGTWTPENDSVSTRVNALTSADSALMQQARASGAATANRRGLLNSSIAAGASEKEALAAAVPIASQEASQIATKNLQYMQGGQQKELASLNNAAETERLNTSIAADLNKLNVANAAEAARLGTQLAADKERTAFLTQAEMDRLTASNTAEAERLQTQLGADKEKTQYLSQAEMDRLNATTAAEAARLDKQLQAERDKTAATIAADDRKTLAELQQRASESYTTGIGNTLQNDQIPATTRTAAQRGVSTVYKDTLQRLGTLYGVELKW